jgi:hypothetical protein
MALSGLSLSVPLRMDRDLPLRQELSELAERITANDKGPGWQPRGY